MGCAFRAEDVGKDSVGLYLKDHMTVNSKGSIALLYYEP